VRKEIFNLLSGIPLDHVAGVGNNFVLMVIVESG